MRNWCVTSHFACFKKSIIIKNIIRTLDCIRKADIILFFNWFLVTLSPKGNVSVCPGRQVKYTCKTIGGALQWKTSSSGFAKIFNNAATPDSDLGIFRVSVQGVHKNGSKVVAVNSTAITLNGVQLNDDGTTLSCLVTTNFSSVEAILKVAGKN